MLVLGQCGCEQAGGVAESPAKVDIGPNVSAYGDYSPAKIHITPLTGLAGSADANGSSKIDVYVSLLDSFGSQVKSPGVFRFELYEYAQRSAEPKGGRVVIWPDINLTDAAENNRFDLPLEPQSDQSCVLQVTFLCVGGKRLSDEFIFKQSK
jgi:hypothetical protein